MEIKEAYQVMQKECGIKVGDTVKVLRKAKSHEMGWSASWVAPDMDAMVGKEFVVDGIFHEGGICRDKWAFPFFVLEKVKDAPVKSSIEQLIDTLDFGCKREAVNRLASAIIAECKK